MWSLGHFNKAPGGRGGGLFKGLETLLGLGSNAHQYIRLLQPLGKLDGSDSLGMEQREGVS